MIAVTTTPLQDGSTVPDAARLSRLQGGATVTRSDDGILTLIQVNDTGSDVALASPRRWRGAFAAGGQLVGLTLYAPPGSAALGDAGARALRQLARRTTAATAKPSSAARNEGTIAKTSG